MPLGCACLCQKPQVPIFLGFSQEPVWTKFSVTFCLRFFTRHLKRTPEYTQKAKNKRTLRPSFLWQKLIKYSVFSVFRNKKYPARTASAFDMAFSACHCRPKAGKSDQANKNKQKTEKEKEKEKRKKRKKKKEKKRTKLKKKKKRKRPKQARTRAKNATPSTVAPSTLKHLETKPARK